MKTVIKVLRGILIAILGCVVLANLWLLVQQVWLHKDPPDLFGYSQFIVTSGSMEPTFSAGDLVVTKPKPEYGLGDVVTFREESGSMVTHRIVGTSGDGFITRGDANNTEDKTLLYVENIVGSMVCSVPAIGSVMLFLKTPLGLLILVVVGVLLVELPVWTGALRKNGKGKHLDENV